MQRVHGYLTGTNASMTRSAKRDFPNFAHASIKVIAVGTASAGRPPHRSVRTELPHTALTLDVDWQTLHLD